MHPWCDVRWSLLLLRQDPTTRIRLELGAFFKKKKKLKWSIYDEVDVY